MESRKIGLATLAVSFGAGLLAPSCASDENAAVDQGQADASKIVGGTDTTIAQNPWQVSLQSGGSHFCGGTIISASWVLTANHCVDGQSASGLKVVAGINKRSQASSGQTRNVQTIIMHPGYTDATNGKDAALLRLATPLDLNGITVKAIPIMTKAAADAGATAAGVVSTVTGWGTLRSGAYPLPDTLQTVDVPLVSNEEAQKAYPSETITDDQLAAGIMGTGGKDSCQGDSGGPLTVSTPAGRALAGIVSWGYGCADGRYPGLYGRVSAFESWILANSDATPIGGAPSPTPEPQPTPTPEPTPNPEPQPTLDPVIPVTLLDRSDLAGSADTWVSFPVVVPAGKAKLDVVMSGGTGDADLYVRIGNEPSEYAYDCRPYENGNEERCTLEVSEGTVFVAVGAFKAYAGVKLTAVAE